jgi:hypothetical protein
MEAELVAWYDNVGFIELFHLFSSFVLSCLVEIPVVYQGNMLVILLVTVGENQTHEDADAFSDGSRHREKDHGEIRSYIEYDCRWFYQNPTWLRL